MQFHKMHGLGNDFVILDVRHKNEFPALPIPLSTWVQQLSNRHTGIGCDQFIVLRSGQNDIPFMQILNADGSEVKACGNATRCVGWLLMQETKLPCATIQTAAGLLEVVKQGEMRVRVSMGKPHLNWEAIPMSHPINTLHVTYGACEDGVAVSMGNPHLVMFVEDVATFPLHDIGSTLEHASIFPEKANITVAELPNRTTIHLHTWERGVGQTLACGTAACATMVAARRRDMVEPSVSLHMAGGTLQVEWEGSEMMPDAPVFMTGDVAYVFRGEILSL
jgi:diaminopimelate epimerase